ncbi:alpha/beta fold hydrolase [Burkholderia sp. 22PA0099]|uniref:alpha/beta fold hydrolase n=1 Tax=Burkholderia sp. 22PA0099 TaxID=3237372 RepID=UPI0039C37F86
MKAFLSVAAMVMTTIVAGGADAAPKVPAAVERWIEPGQPGDYRLHVHERHASNLCGKPPVLLLHGYGVPTAMAFDVQGASLMEHLAQTGRTSFAVDLPGFGKSQRPPEMNGAPIAGKPLIRAADVLSDVTRAVDYVQSVCPGTQVDVIGWSWGGVVAAMWASTQPTALRRLILVDSMYSLHVPSITKLFADPTNPDKVNPNLPSYNIVPVQAIADQWNGMLSTTGLSADALRQPEVAEAVSKVFLESDAGRPSATAIRRPLGPIVDLFEIFSGRPIYDASKVIAPTFVIHGDADNFSDIGMVTHFSQSCGRRELIVGDGTHYMIFEKSRHQVYAALDDYLSSDFPACGIRKKGVQHEN